MADVTDPLPADRSGMDGAAGLDMATRQCAGQVVVALSGGLDVTNAARIRAVLTTVAIRVPWLIVDLAGLKFTDCAGMRALAAVARQAREAGSVLALAAPRPLVLRVFDLTGLMTGVPVYPGVEEAAEVASPQRAARSVVEPDTRAIVAGLPTVRPGRQQEEGSVGPHQQPTAADTRAHNP